MIEETTGGSNNQVDTLGQLVRLCFPVCPTHQDTKSLRMTLHELLRNTEDLQRQFPRRRDDDDSGTYAISLRHCSLADSRRPTVDRLESQCAEHLHTRYQKCHSLSTSGPSCAQHVLSGEKRWDSPSLNLRHGLKSHPLDSRRSRRREVECGERYSLVRSRSSSDSWLVEGNSARARLRLGRHSCIDFGVRVDGLLGH